MYDDIPGMPFIPMTSEQLKAHMDSRYMKFEALNQDVQRLFSEMEPEKLSTLKIIFNNIAASGNMSSSTASYFEGQCAAILYAVHNTCTACGKDHVEDLLEDKT